MSYFILKERMGSNEGKLFLIHHRITHIVNFHKGEKREFLFCSVLPFTEKFFSVSHLLCPVGKDHPVSSLYTPWVTLLLLDLDSNVIGCTKHHYYLFKYVT